MSGELAVLFNYPDEVTALYCEEKVAEIRELSTTLKKGIVDIGAILIQVKQKLGHGAFEDWLGFHFGMGRSTAANYMNAARAVKENPKLWNYEPSVMYMWTRSLPESAKEAILNNGPISCDQAKVLIQECKGDDWYNEVTEVLEEEPGQAYTRATWAMGDPHLRDHAARFLRDNSHRFAVESDREPWEVQKEAGMNLSERMNADKAIPATLYLHEGEDNHRISLWVDGDDPEVLAYLPPPRTAGGRAWQYKMVNVLRQQLSLRTADDIVEEEL
jgi:hypothetical protein